MIHLLYFAWVREQLGRDGEEYALAEPVPLAALLDKLTARGVPYATALHDAKRLRFAVNHDMRGLDWTVRPGDEVAIFPPVTGG